MHRSNFAVKEPHPPALRATHGPFSGNGRPAARVVADVVVRIEDGKLVKHWDVPQDEATKAQSVSELPMFGDRFPD
jgi:predicted SnoaL-like aldol condensation-catalyzing enzyme